MTTLHEYIMANYKSVTDYATRTQRNYPLVKRWCDKNAVIMFDQIYVPSTQLQDGSAPPMVTLADHIKKRYDGNMCAAAMVMGRHRNQLATWCKRSAILINGRVWLPKGIA